MTALSETPFRKEKIGHLFERGNRILAALSFADESDSLFLNRKGLFEGRAGYRASTTPDGSGCLHTRLREQNRGAGGDIP